MTEAMPFLQKYDITFLRPPAIRRRDIFILRALAGHYARFCSKKSRYSSMVME